MHTSQESFKQIKESGVAILDKKGGLNTGRRDICMNDNIKEITVWDILGKEDASEAPVSESTVGNETKKAIRERAEYKTSLPRLMYTFFTSYSDAGAPSFVKFARSIGVTLSDVEGWREISEFDRAYRECGEIRRDYLIDSALTKRYDSSFAKYLLSYEYGMDEKGVADSEIEVTVEVIE